MEGKERNAPLVSLERSLAQHVQRLCELCNKEEEEDEDEEIEKTTEHVSTINRKIYDLEQKVSQVCC